MNRNSLIRTAHRGASAHYPENTLLAFRKAVEQGVDMLELDVHSTADAHLIVMHDATLDRTTNGHGNVNDHSLEEIRQLDAGLGQMIPLLEEVIQLARDSQVRLGVEVKTTTEEEEVAATEAVIRTLEAGAFLDRAIVTSFSPKALLRAKSMNHEVSTMLDPSPQDGSLSPREVCAQVLRAGANSLCYDFRFLTAEIVRECQLTGLALWAWDPDEPADLERMIRLGVSGIMTNRPDILNQVLHDIAV